MMWSGQSKSSRELCEGSCVLAESERSDVNTAHTCMGHQGHLLLAVVPSIAISIIIASFPCIAITVAVVLISSILIAS